MSKKTDNPDQAKSTIVSIDLGYSKVKATSSTSADEIISFPSTAVDPSIAPTNFGGETEADITIVDETDWVVGLPRQASFVSPLQPDFCQSPEYKALVAETLRRLKISQVDYLVLGLPSAHFRTGRKLMLEEAFSSSTIEVNGETISISKVSVVSQPLGAVAAKLADGTSSDDMGELLVVDIGHFTTDVEVVTADSQLDPTSVMSSTLAMAHVWKEVVDRIPFPADLDQVASRFVAGTNLTLTKRGKTVELKPIVTETVAAVACNLIAEIKSRIGDFGRIGEILIVGGGAELFRTHFEKEFSDLITVPKNPVYANAIGFGALVKSVIGEG